MGLSERFQTNVSYNQREYRVASGFVLTHFQF
jgi:hypothetical protein